MKSNTLWVLISGLAVGFIIGQQVGSRSGGSGGSGSAKTETPTTVAAAQAPAGEIPANWLKEDALKATDKFAGLTPAQRYVVLKVMNEKPCDCGCPHGTTAACLKDDPGCPRAPVILNKAIEMAKAGSNYDAIIAAVKKSDAPAAPSAPAPSTFQKVELAKWTPVKGPKYAKVTVVLFSDFQCPFCSRVEPTLKELETKYGKDVRIAWRNQPLPFHPNATPAAKAAMAAGRQGKFWEFHDKLFANQQALDEATYEKYAQELGLSMSKWKADKDSKEIADEIEADSKAGTGWGASGTPTMFINGQQLVGAQPITAFTPVVDAEIKKADELLKKGTSMDKLYEKILESAPAAPAAPAAAAEPPAEHVDIQPGDAPVKGPKNAKVTVVIFSDFQCPFCSRVEPTLKQLEDEYKGKIRFAWKNQPLPFHQNAMPAAEAAMAAGAQGKFWEMHDKLFANQQALDRPTYEKHAQELGLNLAKFKADLDSHKFEAQIKKDSEEGNKVGANGTPTFFINGNKLVGAQPVDAFKKLIDAELKK